ncbi:hypothetical protein HAX54_009062 [Datura stramonium]|uniref:Uncharacterized protein n=1 Tax=Datura stramonium TaxID=4076 RepID=A0ABS8TEF8_DATST|nr:hypothetical protein [Datura stramonium]
MEMEAWLEMIETITEFWDDSRMVFLVGDVELTPTLEEVLESFESLLMVHKRKTQSDDDILIPQKWSHEQNSGYEKFKEEFTSYQNWKDRRAYAFVECLLGTMAFHHNGKHGIHPHRGQLPNSLNVATFDGYRPNHTKKYWARLFGGLREGDVEWKIRELMPKNNIVHGRNIPFLPFARIRGVRPYAPIRVLRQFGIKQIVPQEDLQITLTPGPDTYDQVEDVESKAQEGRLAITMERGSATVSGETEKSLLEKINKVEEYIAMTRRRIEQVDQNKEALLVMTEEIDQQMDWVKRRIARIDLEIAASIRALHEVSKSFPTQWKNFEDMEQLLQEFAHIMRTPKVVTPTEEDKEVSLERNNTKEKFGVIPNDGSFWQVRFTQGNGHITFKAHFRNYLRDPEVISCSTIYQTLQSLGILHLIEGGGSRCDPRAEYK